MAYRKQMAGLTRWAASALLAGVALFAARDAAAAVDMVVAEAKGVPSLQQGQTIDGSQVLKLEPGQRVTLIGSDGRTIKLRGPFNDVPAPTQTADNGGVVDSLKGLVANRGAGTATLGVVRSGATEHDLPEPWLVDVTRPGNRCLVENQQAVFYWPEVGAERTPWQISSADKSLDAKAAWPAQQPKLAIPASLPLRDGQTYSVTLAGKTSDLTFHVIPATLDKPAVRAAWMVEKGCEQQAAALVKTIQ